MFNWLLTLIQKEAIYGGRRTEEIVVPEGFKLVEFEDSKTSPSLVVINYVVRNFCN